MMGGETAWNMQSIDSNKEYCVTLHLVGYTSKEYINDARSHKSQKKDTLLFLLEFARHVFLLQY
jgi:hypothetical protein